MNPIHGLTGWPLLPRMACRFWSIAASCSSVQMTLPRVRKAFSRLARVFQTPELTTRPGAPAGATPVPVGVADTGLYVGQPPEGGDGDGVPSGVPEGVAGRCFGGLGGRL